MKFENEIYEAIVRWEVKGQFVEYYNTDKMEARSRKIILLPNLFCGNILNITVEFYDWEERCTNSGIASRTGWHVQPTFAKRWEKTPYRVETLTPNQVNSWFKNVIFNVMQ